MVCDRCKKKVRIGFCIALDIFEVMDKVRDGVFDERNTFYVCRKCGENIRKDLQKVLDKHCNKGGKR